MSLLLLFGSASAPATVGYTSIFSDLGGGVAANAYTLTAEAGSFALGGQSATLKRGLRLDAAAGSFSLTGQAATLNYVSGGQAGAHLDAAKAWQAHVTRRRSSGKIKKPSS